MGYPVTKQTFWLPLIMFAVGSVIVFEARADDRIRFDRQIRPILAEACFECHGPDAQTREADLRLDDEASLFEDRGGYAAIVRGSVDESEAMRRIVSTDADERMPPADHLRQLTDEEIKLLEDWITQGAEWEGHWAFEPRTNPEIPAEASLEVEQNAIDRFVGLVPSKINSLHERADSVVLLRRLSFDLTGLPPTPEDVLRVANSQRPDVIEREIDRLLASPHYGEHMARTWLDAARYADTNGYQYDTERTQWPWREWVINAYSSHMPFDQFLREQLAGDLLTNPTLDQLIATGFNRNHGITIEGGVIDEEYRTEYVMDRVVTTATSFLGLTALCARCHDHKFDPLSQREFYQLYGFFNQVPERGLSGFAPQVDYVSASYQQATERLNFAKAKLKEIKASALAAQIAWEKQQSADATQRSLGWQAIEVESATSTAGASFEKQADGSWLASGGKPAAESYEVRFSLGNGRDVRWLRLEALRDDSLPGGGAGRAFNSNFVLSEVLLSRNVDGQWIEVGLDQAVADYSQSGFGIEKTIDSNPNSGWAVDGPTKKETRLAAFRLKENFLDGDDVPFKLVLKFNYGSHHSIGRFRLSSSSRPKPSLTDNAWQYLEIARQDRTPQQQQAIDELFLESEEAPANWVTQVALVEKLGKAQQRAATENVKVMVMRDRPDKRVTNVLHRGQYNEPQEEVEPGIPAILGTWNESWPRNRLGLASWLLDEKHPLTARVAVNRWWQGFFETGLVETPEDFGTQGARPSHPELLDWLAEELIRHDWDRTWIQRKIATSATYQRTSQVSAKERELDPRNRWLTRGPSKRLSAEAVRDSVLYASGSLIPQIGGPSVYPYHPEGLWLEINNRPNYSKPYPHQGGAGLYRRSLYTFWKRTVPPPSMQTFDAPEREFCVVRRSTTNTPLQAFVLLHDPQFVEAARNLAIRTLNQEAASDEEAVDWMVLASLGRRPDAQEKLMLVDVIRKRREYYKANREQADALLSVGESELPSRYAVHEVAAWTTAARVLFNLSELVTNR